MSASVESLELWRCASCRSLFLPTPAPCPRCGASERRRELVPGLAVVLAATELSYPPEGFPAPHRIALVELVEAARLLAAVDGPLPARGDTVSIRWQEDHYVVRGAP